jgi:hypothetical protein
MDSFGVIIMGSLGALASAIGGVMYMHSFAEGGTQ